MARRPWHARPRQSRPDDPDKDPWTGTQVSHSYAVHLAGAARKGVLPASRERWMAVKGLEAAEVVNGWQRYRVVARRCECEDCKGEGPVGASGCLG